MHELNIKKHFMPAITLCLLCALIIGLSLVLSPVIHAIESDHSGKVVAQIGYYEITIEDLNRSLQKSPLKRRRIDKKSTLNKIIQTRVFSEEARKAGLDKKVVVIKELERIKKEVLSQFFIMKVVNSKAQSSEDELKRLYDKNKSQFVVPESVSIQHLVYKDKQKASRSLKRLKNGKSFDWLARKGSIGTCWENGGYHGKFYRGRIDPELEKAVFNFKKGTISDVIKTDDNYQIVKVLDKNSERQLPFSEVKSKIKNGIYTRKRTELIAKYYESAEINRDPIEKDVLVEVYGNKIPMNTISHLLDKTSSDSEKQKIRKKWQEYFIDIEVFSREALSWGIEKDPETKKELTCRYDELLAKVFNDDIIKNKIFIDNKLIEEYYRSHKNEFKEPVKYRAKVIMVQSLRDAQEIRQELISHGKSFVYLAQNRSLHPSAARRGAELGWFEIGDGKFDHKIENAVSALKPGEISPVTKTDKGFYIFKLIDKRGGELSSLEEQRAFIKKRLKKRSMEQIAKGYVEKAGVQIFLP